MLTVIPEFSSIKDFTSALLIPLNFPVTKKDLSFNIPLVFFAVVFLISKTFPNSSKTLTLISFPKKVLIEFTWTSPIPSIFNKSE